jgi:uncharacterized protein (DUF302 family)
MIAAILVAFLLSLPLTNFGVIYGQDNGVVSVTSKYSFDKTESQIRHLVSQNGMMVLSQLNQGKIMSMSGVSLKDISLFVGNPKVGKKLFTQDAGVGLVVPIRINIYDGKDGKTHVNYIKPSSNLAYFNNDQINNVAKMLDQKLSKLTGMISE